MTVSLPMYPFPEWRGATETLWETVRDHVPDLPPLAAWDAGDDTHALWRSPSMVVSQACGWPLVTELTGLVRVVGTFRYRTRRWAGDRYRSVVVARRDAGAPASGTAAVNGHDSLSGWVSLVAFLSREPDDVLVTGSHLASLAAVVDGTAAFASVDAVTFAYAESHRPDLVAGLTVVGEGPCVPCLPLITRIDATDDRVETLRHALAAAVAEQPGPAATLLIDGFSPLDDAHYHAALAPWVTDPAPPGR